MLLVAIATILMLGVGFVLLADEVVEAETTALDEAILRAMRDATGKEPIGPAWFERTMVNLSALGSVAVAMLVVALASSFLFLARRPRQALLVIGCALGTALAINLLKLWFARARPDMIAPIDLASGMSFPSGHSLLAAAIYPTLGMIIATALEARRLKAFVFATAVVLALVIGLSRVYLGVHYPTDVIGGWILGIAWALVCGLVARVLQRRGVVEQPADSAE